MIFSLSQLLCSQQFLPSTLPPTYVYNSQSPGIKRYHSLLRFMFLEAQDLSPLTSTNIYTQDFQCTLRVFTDNQQYTLPPIRNMCLKHLVYWLWHSKHSTDSLDHDYNRCLSKYYLTRSYSKIVFTKTSFGHSTNCENIFLLCECTTHAILLVERNFKILNQSNMF